MLADSQIRRLLDIGNAATQSGNVVDARLIFDGVLAMRPNFSAAILGKSLSHIVVDDFATAEALLNEKVLAENPEDEEGRVLLAMIYKLSNREDQARIILESLMNAKESVAEVAKGLLA